MDIKKIVVLFSLSLVASFPLYAQKRPTFTAKEKQAAIDDCIYRGARWNPGGLGESVEHMSYNKKANIAYYKASCPCEIDNTIKNKYAVYDLGKKYPNPNKLSGTKRKQYEAEYMRLMNNVISSGDTCRALGDKARDNFYKNNKRPSYN